MMIEHVSSPVISFLLQKRSQERSKYVQLPATLVIICIIIKVMRKRSAIFETKKDSKIRKGNEILKRGAGPRKMRNNSYCTIFVPICRIFSSSPLYSRYF